MFGFEMTYQRDTMQCGVACLSMICRHFGKFYSLSFLENHCSPSREGVSLNAIKDGAEALGLKVEGGKWPIDYIEDQDLPCVLHWNQNHYVVLYKVGRLTKRYYIADPGRGKCSLTKAQLTKECGFHEDGVDKVMALCFEKGPDFGKVDGVKTEKRSIGFLLKYIWKYKAHLIQVLAGMLVGCLLSLVMPFLTQSIVDIGITNQDVNFIWLILLGESMIVIGRASIGFIRSWVLLHVSMRINLSMVSDFFIKLLGLPMKFFDTKMMGDLLQRMGDYGRIQSFLTSQVLDIVFNILSFGIFATVLLIYSKTVFLILLVGSVVYAVWICCFLDKRKYLDNALYGKSAEYQQKTYQFITSMQEIKLQNCKQRRRWEWEEAQTDLFGLQMKCLKLQQGQSAGAILITEVKDLFITIFAATAVVEGSLTLGAMLAIQYIVGQLSSPVSSFLGFIYSLQDVKISLERINEIHELPEEASKGAACEFADASGNLSLSRVYFKYDRHSSKQTLSDVSLLIPKGKVTAIVGGSGSGKTTLLKLLLGYYKVDRGNVFVSGSTIGDYNLSWWRNHCGVVMQDGLLFSESIARNIAVDDGEIDRERMIAAAKTANIHDFVENLPLGYETKVGPDGVGVSQGQKQRILIARAVYKNPDYIFLDEATNALDAKNEREIADNLQQFYEGRTVIVVAHRLSTVRNADQIVVMGAGSILETGTHEELVEKKGEYYQLVKNQLELGA